MSRSKPHDFDDSLRFGRDNERLFCELTGSTLAGGRDYDAVMPDGSFVEVKACRYDNSNLFFKKTSDLRSPERLSGPWKAAYLGVHLYAYYKISHRRFYLFDSRELAAWLDENAHRYRLKEMHSVRQSRGWTGNGFPVPISHIRHLIKASIDVPGDT